MEEVVAAEEKELKARLAERTGGELDPNLDTRLAKSGGDLKGEDADIELHETAPPFLNCHTSESPHVEVKFVRDTQESLQRRAETSSVRALLSTDPSLSSISATTDGDLPVNEHRESLPIFDSRSQLLHAVENNRVLLVCGQRGCGVTTQLPQYLVEAGYTAAAKGIIGCALPHHMAPMSVAKRVSKELGCPLGQKVGYVLPAESKTSQETVIKYMSKDVLLRELLADPTASKYSVILLDHACERTIETDMLSGLLKAAVQRRSDLKVIIRVARHDAALLDFFNCPALIISGPMSPVDIYYTEGLSQEDYLEASVSTVMHIHANRPPGDILLFLPDKAEVEMACELIRSSAANSGELPQTACRLVVLPLYSEVAAEMLPVILQPAQPNSRKCVVATGTFALDCAHYVIDSGFCKQKVYDAKLRTDALVVTPVSQDSAMQRARLAAVARNRERGECFRLYTDAAYANELIPNDIPEIRRASLGRMVLLLKAMGVDDLLHFEHFVERPPVEMLAQAMDLLHSLGAVDDEGRLTRLGRKMAEFPLEPQMSKALISSIDLGCSEELLTIVAMLSAGDVFYRPKDNQEEADAKRAKFLQPEGDHLTLLAVYKSWEENKFSDEWCTENFIQARQMRRAFDIRKQLVAIMDRYRLPIVSCGKNWNLIRKAITSGYFMHAAKRDADVEAYRALVDGRLMAMHPSSALFERQPKWFLCHQVVLGSEKAFMRYCMAIDPGWLPELAPRFFKAPAADPRKSEDNGSH